MRDFTKNNITKNNDKSTQLENDELITINEFNSKIFFLIINLFGSILYTVFLMNDILETWQIIIGFFCYIGALVQIPGIIKYLKQ